MRQRLLGASFRRRIAIQDVLTPAQKSRRLQWAQERLVFDWTRVIFSDEMVISLRNGKNMGKIYVWRRVGERHRVYCVIPVPPIQRRGSITVWGCLSYFGFGCLETFTGTMDSIHYTEKTLPDYLIPSSQLLYPDQEPFIFMQDNASPHTARITKAWLQENRIRTLDWPPYSPDLNPIENVWGLLKKRLYQDMPRSPDQIISVL